MRVLITGGAGYLGTELIRSICVNDKVEKIIVYDNFSRKNHGLFMPPKLLNPDKMKVVEGDVLDSRLLKSVLKEVDQVVHLAATVSTPYANTDPHSYDQVNNWGTAELVYAIEENKNIQSMIHLSTTSIYGFPKNVIDENFIPAPSSSYGLSKWRGEKHVMRLAESDVIRTLVLRTGNVFGFSPSMRMEAVVNKFIFEAKYFGKIYLHGNGEQIRPFICITDITKVISEALLNSKIQGGLYNVFRENIQVTEIANLLLEIFPNLEMQRLNQHIKYGSLMLKENPTISKILESDKRPLKEKLIEFINQMSF